jgi:hypothetical protein
VVIYDCTGKVIAVSDWPARQLVEIPAKEDLLARARSAAPVDDRVNAIEQLTLYGRDATPYLALLLSDAEPRVRAAAAAAHTRVKGG